MKRGWNWLSRIISGGAMIACCHAAPLPTTDAFLLLSPPTLASNQVQFTLTGEATVTYVIESSIDLENWIPVATNSVPPWSNSGITREIVLDLGSNGPGFYRAWRDPLPMFPGALVARSNITFNGNSIMVDSYDSWDTNHSTWGLYDPTKRKAGGDVFSAAGFIAVGNANINGKLSTGPLNAGQYSIGPYGSVGDLNWSGPGIQPGWYFNDFRYALPDVLPPYATGLPPAGKGTNLWLLGSAEYMYVGNFSASSSQTIYVEGKATVYVTGSFIFPGTIRIAPGGRLKLYVGGLSSELGSIIHNGTAFDFQYYGLPANTNISCKVDDVLTGVCYAPQAALNLMGAINQFTDVQGACVVESVTLNGHFNFHYDENLKRRGPMR